MFCDCFWDILAANICGIRGDAQMKVWLKTDYFPIILYIEFHSHRFVFKDDGELLADHAEHLEIKAVEFIKADPHASYCHAFHNPDNNINAKRLRTIVDNAAFTADAGNIFCSLTFARACWPDR
jgi:hypothetical protein